MDIESRTPDDAAPQYRAFGTQETEFVPDKIRSGIKPDKDGEYNEQNTAK